MTNNIRCDDEADAVTLGAHARIIREKLLNSVHMAVRWLLYSGVYHLDSDPQAFGGVDAHYEAKRKTFVYTEITAYAIRVMLNLYRLFGQKTFLDYAERSGKWLINVMQYTGSDKNAYGSFSWALQDGERQKRAFSFDMSICVDALVDLYCITKRRRYLDSAENGGKWLAQIMQNPAGSIRPCYDWGRKEFVGGRESAWYLASGAYHCKVCIGLLRLYDVTHYNLYQKSAQSICKWAESQRLPTGQFKTNEYLSKTNLHAHCYALEGFLYAYLMEGNQDYLSIVQDGVGWLLTLKKFPLWYPNGGNITSYVLAQVVRLSSLLHLLTGKEEYERLASKLIPTLLLFQNTDSSDTRAYGGFHEGRKEYLFGLIRKKARRINSWSTIFSIQALLTALSATTTEKALLDLF